MFFLYVKLWYSLKMQLRRKNLAEIESCYKDTKFLLQDVMTRMNG